MRKCRGGVGYGDGPRGEARDCEWGGLEGSREGVEEGFGGDEGEGTGRGACL